jgi:hypothetical protein
MPLQTTMFALAHVYPTAIRASGVDIAVAIGRPGDFHSDDI